MPSVAAAEGEDASTDAAAAAAAAAAADALSRQNSSFLRTIGQLQEGGLGGRGTSFGSVMVRIRGQQASARRSIAANQIQTIVIHQLRTLPSPPPLTPPPPPPPPPTPPQHLLFPPIRRNHLSVSTAKNDQMRFDLYGCIRDINHSQTIRV